MSTHANMVKMTVTSVASAGEGTITLGAASSGYLHINSQITASGTVGIRVYNAAGAFEVCRNCAYTYNATTTLCTIDRGTLEAGSNGASRVAFDTGGTGVTVELVATAELGNKLEAALKSVTPGGRLTLESGVPVSTTDQTEKTSLYYTPYVHNIINLWDGSEWKPISFTEYTLALGTLTSGKPYDVFAYLSSGALALEMLVWTSDTARATAVTLQDGRYCKSGDKTRLLLGTFYTTATTTTEDSAAKRYVSNVYNTTARALSSGVVNTLGHAYTTFSWREWNGGTSSPARIRFINTLPTGTVQLGANVNMDGDGSTISLFSLGIDTTSTAIGGLDVGVFTTTANTVYFVSPASITGSLAAGAHYVAAIEAGQTGGYYTLYNLFGSLDA